MRVWALGERSNLAGGRIGWMNNRPADLEACPHLGAAFAILGKKWNALILDLLVSRPARFTEIHRAVPDLSDKVLTERLAELTTASLIVRDTDDRHPTYRLTDAGAQLAPALNEIRRWGEDVLVDPPDR